MNLAEVAREGLRDSRRRARVSPAEYAAALTRRLGREVTADDVAEWETTGVPPGDVVVAVQAERYADVSEIYVTRPEFTHARPVESLFDGARDVRAAGLSLVLLCHWYGEDRIRALVERGARVQCLFLEPESRSIRIREREEGLTAGQLSAVNEANIAVVTRVRDALSGGARQRLEIGTFDETVRFNITLIDRRLCIAQPYLPFSRGIDAPTLVVRNDSDTGLYPVFEEIYASLWSRRSPR
ncbi:DUF5919 domain-containing protein [Saccharothrix obliqua]|uniref:DUF5919 domain-containing protein n=1 Tax=Saccharothrix obliqua TaxID=2861747 RepID=UPI001C5E53E1|nr:DUF5919 domain-containing protein [Saccharothrix obliqua]MBW4720529.1 hypothetical protein [Saccharothrix obliqua]